MLWIGLSLVAFGAALLAASGLAGVFYASIYIVAIAPGVFLGRRAMAGHAAGWIGGGLIGYGATQLALWLPVFLGVPSVPVFVLAWLVQAGLLVWLGRCIGGPILTLPVWTAADRRALALTLLLVPLLLGPTYRNVGAADKSGTRWYRAYFTADFVWHTALTSELGRYESPPRNPYMASQTIHYYWTYFLLPAVVAQEGGASVQDALKANAMLSAMLVLAMLLLLTRTAVPQPGAAAAAVALVVLATSAEGAYTVRQLWLHGKPFAELLETNIDAVSSWEFLGLRIDSLVRGLWYNPQHSVSCALGLLAAFVAASAGAGASRGAIWLAGGALGLATTMNPFVGAVCAAIYGLAVTMDALGRPGTVRTVLRHVQAAIPVILALVWCTINRVTDGAATAVSFGWLVGLAGKNTVQVLLISMGPVLVPALFGIWPWRALPSQPLRVAVIGTLLSLLLMHTMTLSDPSWVGFRTGQLVQLMLPLMLARVLWALGRSGLAWPAALATAILVLGLPTMAIDTFNAQDITNRRMGPEFHWTVPVTAAQQQAFAWIRRSVPQDAIVQMEPVLRGREHWSLIPSFAERRMSVGLPISLLPMPEYEEGSREVQQIYQTMTAREAWDAARRRGIAYFYVDSADRAAYGDGLAKFDTGPQYFIPVFRNPEVTIYKVK